MKKLFQKIVVCTVLATLLAAWGLPVAGATDEPTQEEQTEEEVGPIISDAVRNAYLVVRLRQYLQQSERNYYSLQDKMDNTREQIDGNRYELGTLEGDVAQLDGLIIGTEAKIESVTAQISLKEIEIQESLEDLEFTGIQIEEQKDVVGSYMRLVYFEKNLNSSANMETNFLKLFLRDGSISKSLQSSSFLSILEKQAGSLIGGLQSLEREQTRENYALTSKRNQLDELEEQLEAEYRNLTAQLEGKQNLLKDTENEDGIYRELFASYKAAQEAILEEINLFQTNISALEDRLKAYETAITDEELEQIEDIKNEYWSDHSTLEAANFLDLDWPVSPKWGLTAYFEDDGYVSRFGVTHHALDVRVAHGSIIYAPSDGVVYKVHDAAALEDDQDKLGYGYIILAHRMGTMTLYGHTSSALVEEGDFVKRGQMIGLTGGTPGTPGAGVRTTGAHLHFEVIQDGVRVDPLEYLPLSEVPGDYMLPQYTTMLETQILEELKELEAEQEAAEEAAEAAALEEAGISENDLVQQTIENSFVNELSEEEQDDFWTHGEQSRVATE